MRVQSVVPWIAVVGTLTGLSPRAAVGQELTLAARTPRFFYAPSTAAKRVEIDVSRNAVLGRVVSLHVEHSTIGGLLAEIQRQTGLTFAYDPHFPATRSVTLEAEAITVAAALGAILVGTGEDVVLTPTGHVWLTESKPPTPRPQEGAIAGKVSDEQTGTPLVGATVTLESARQSAVTGSDGRYRFANLSPGNYTVRARYIGYGALAASVAVSADQEVTIDFPLQKSPHHLDEVVTTGTVIPTEVRALPTPVSVVTAEDISQQRPHTVQELFRQSVPTAVSWDDPSNPYYTAFAARGASTLAGQVGQMKVFVDGVEAAQISLAAIDPSSIERLEVIRGPQAGAIYGSDAIGGVIQVFTKRGDPSLTRPQVDAEAALGLIQTPYDGFGGVLRQEYKASVRGGASDLGYNLGASYSHTGDYLPNGEQSAQSNPSVFAGMRFARGVIAVDLTGRYYVQNTPAVINPEFSQTGFAFFSKPNYRPQEYQNQTVGARLSLAPTRWWQHTVTAGFDRVTQDLAQSRRRFTFPGDTLLTLINQAWSKASVAYNTSLASPLGSGVSGSLTAGFDHYSLPFTRILTVSALNTTGNIQTPPGQSIAVARTATSNTGYFAQAQLAVRDALFLTAGVRAEQNSEFGDRLGTPVSPRGGLSYVQPVRGATLKLRGSWGRAIRAPAPGQKLAIPTSTPQTLANPELGPERQEGWDTGIDAVFGGRASLSITYYDQTADDLIQYVQLPDGPAPAQQAQNIAAVKNTGLEVEGTLSVASVRLKGYYGYARARVQQLPPGYTGDLRVGDQTLMTPKHTAGVSLMIAPFARTAVAAALTYVGSWKNYDYLAQYHCFGGTGRCEAVSRNYITAYPGFVKVNVRVSQQVTQLVSGFVSVDNLTNNQAFEASAFAPVVGRISTVGLQFHY